MTNSSIFINRLMVDLAKGVDISPPKVKVSKHIYDDEDDYGEVNRIIDVGDEGFYCEED